MCAVELETGVAVGEGWPGTSAENPAAAAASSLAECDPEAGRQGDELAPEFPPLFKNGTKAEDIIGVGCLI
jgi:hypothetical protein